jgi:putative ABC transport system permease protein
MNKWLQDFVYRVSFSWWIFLAAGLAALLIALVTVSSQAVRAAMANPIRSLRME